MSSRFEYTESGNIIDHEPDRSRRKTFEELRDAKRKSNESVGKILAIGMGLTTLVQLIISLLR